MSLLILGTSCKWNPIIFVLLCLDYFTQHNVCKVHPCLHCLTEYKGNSMEKDLFNKDIGTIRYLFAKIRILTKDLIPYTKINSTWVTDRSIKPKTINI